MAFIYHIATNEDWNRAQQTGSYDHPSLHSEGFIHCSMDHQVAGVLERYFRHKENLLKLVIDTDKLTSKFVYDWSPPTQDTYPHVYGPINIESVIEIIRL